MPAPAEERIQVACSGADPDSTQARQLTGHGEEVFQGSLDDPDSLMHAMDGVYGVFSVQSHSANEIQQGVAIIEAAKRQGVSHFAYSSVGSADEERGIPHFESKVKVEEHLRSSGLQHGELAQRIRRVDPERAASAAVKPDGKVADGSGG